MNSVIINNIPITTKDKVHKLKCVLIKRIKEHANIKVDFDILMNGDNNYPYIIIKHNKAQEIFDAMDNFHLDKKHKLSTFLDSEIDEILKTSDDYIESDVGKSQTIDNIYDYLNKDCCSQFITCSNKIVNLYTNNYQVFQQKNSIVLCHIKKSFDEDIFSNFSNTGKYYYVIDSNCLQIFIKTDLLLFLKIDGKKIINICFSKNDKYMTIIYDNILELYDTITFKNILCIHNNFHNIKFSYNNSFLLAISKKDLHIISIKNKKTNVIKDIYNYDVSNISNIITYSTDSSIVIINIDNEKELKTLLKKQLYFVTSIKTIFNQHMNLILCYIKRFNNQPNIIELVDLTNVNKITSNVMNTTDSINAIEWCSNNYIFMIATSKEVKMYNNNKEIHKICKDNIKQIDYSALGKYIILSNLLFSSIVSIFDMETKKCVEIQYNGCTNISRDNTDRFIVLYSSRMMNSKNNGYKIYTFQGDLIHQESINNFDIFIWRPMPATQITSDKIQKIKKVIANDIKDGHLFDILKNIQEDEQKLSDGDNLNMLYGRLDKYKTFIETIEQIKQSLY